MAVQRISKRLVDSLSPTGSEVSVWDDLIPGFGIRMRATGHKSYFVRYRLAGLGRRAKSERFTLGEHGVITSEQARTLAKQLLGQVAQGLNPAAERASKKTAETVEDVGASFLEDVRSRRKPTTAKEYARLWYKHVVPVIGSSVVTEVSVQDIRRLHRAMRTTPYLANRVVAMLAGFFTFASQEGNGPITENPAHGIEFYPEQPRERFLTPEEFQRIGKALADAERTGLPPAPTHRRIPGKPENQKHRPKTAGISIPANPFAVAAIRLLALTGCRDNEILSLRWNAVDIERGHLRLADSKTGKSVRPLGQSAAAILETLPRFDNNPFVLPGMKPGSHLKEIKRLWYAVRYAANLDGLRLHDLRHSFASVPAESGESLLVLRSLLGHKRAATTERYAHLSDNPVKRAANEASQKIAGWLRSSETEGALHHGDTE